MIDAWLAAGCPTPAPNQHRRHARAKAANTRTKIRALLDGHVQPVIGALRVERTPTATVEGLFAAMNAAYATSTIRHTSWPATGASPPPWRWAEPASSYGSPLTPPTCATRYGSNQAWIESFFGHIKTEWPHLDDITDPRRARS